MKQLSLHPNRKSAGIFMLLMALFSLVALAATAQKSFSVALTSPAPNSTFVKGQMYNLSFKITNTGTVTMAATDTLMIGIAIDGKHAFIGGGTCSMAIAPGTSQTYQISNLSFSDFTANSDNSNLCMMVMLPNNTNSNSSNGMTCQTIKLRLPAPTGVAGQTKEDAVNVYPNPAGDFLKVKGNSATEGDIRLYDMAGRQVTVLAINGSEQTISTAAYPAGQYFYRVMNKTGILLKSGQVTVQH